MTYRRTLCLPILITMVWFCNSLTADWALAQKQLTCPICLQDARYSKVSSFSATAFYSSLKYQYILAHFASPHYLCSCQNCSFTAFSSDFQQLPIDKLEAVQKALKDMAIDLSHYNNYLDIPMSTRLMIAEKVYTIWRRSPQEWCDFYRIKGYHLENEAQVLNKQVLSSKRKKNIASPKTVEMNSALLIILSGFRGLLKPFIAKYSYPRVVYSKNQNQKDRVDTLKQQAKEARQKSLDYAQKMLDLQEYKSIRKEILYISGAMRFYLEDIKGARKDFNEALKTTYQASRMKPEDQKGFDLYLNEITNDYLKKIGN